MKQPLGHCQGVCVLQPLASFHGGFQGSVGGLFADHDEFGCASDELDDTDDVLGFGVFYVGEVLEELVAAPRCDFYGEGLQGFAVFGFEGEEQRCAGGGEGAGGNVSGEDLVARVCAAHRGL